ncbi:MAG: phenylalanine--tRNA ligase subunit beta [Planctomycetes bacterium]|nr:phenylalanine--tRNA ligase subunit beta [Planctomycetota bacterium]
MKLPIFWLNDYLDGGVTEAALEQACARWGLKPHVELADTLGMLLSFSGFHCDGIEGSGAEAVLELDVLSNRPDAQCVVGLAREVAAMLRVGFKEPPCGIEEIGEPVEKHVKMRVEDAELCPRYTARVIRGVKVQESPDWLKKRLAALGLIPRNNVVDITNFICFELNQPLHAFDLKKLKERTIVVRRARDKEPFRPLYGEIPPLTSETLMICDAERPVAAGGVIGGAGSEVDASTADILLEAAYFSPANTRRTSRRLKVSTDSSYRFERGIDQEAVDRASARAARLIVELAGGTLCKGILDSNPQPREPKSVTLRAERLRKVFGVDVPPAETARHLQAIGCEVLEQTPEAATVRIPSWRRGDLEREIDLIEEVARLHGYHHIPIETSMPARIPPRGNLEVVSDRMRDLLTGLGYFECVTDSLIDPKWPAPAVWAEAKPLALDPVSVMREDHSALRNSLLVSLMAVAKHNQDRRTGTGRYFECGKVFLPHQGKARPDERPVLGVLDEAGFATLADAVLRIGESLEVIDAHLKLKPLAEFGKPPAFLVAESACRLIRVREEEDGGRAEDAIGWLGVASADLCKAFDVKGAPAVAEIDLAKLASLPRGPRRYAPLPTQPAVGRDLAIVIDEAVTWGEVQSFASSYARNEPLRAAKEAPEFLSVYRGKQIGPGKKSLAFSVVYRAADRSLTDEEVNAAHEKFSAAVCERFEATVRK